MLFFQTFAPFSQSKAQFCRISRIEDEFEAQTRCLEKERTAEEKTSRQVSRAGCFFADPERLHSLGQLLGLAEAEVLEQELEVLAEGLVVDVEVVAELRDLTTPVAGRER